MREAVLKVPFIASFGSFIDDTSVLADLILPDHSFLEAWSDARAESGAAVAVATLAPPAMRPLHQTRATPDVWLEISRRMTPPLDLPWATFDEMLKASFSTLGPGAPEEVWAQAQRQGGWWGEAPARPGPARAAGGAHPPQGGGAVEATFDGAPDQFPFYFLPYASQALYDGSLAHLPWLQELPDVISTAMWSTWVEINPQTAARLQIAEGDVVEVGSQHGTLRAPALVSPGLAPDVLAMPVGQGHGTFTRYASGRGVNPLRLLAPVTEPATGALAWAATRVRLVRLGPGDGRLVLFAGSKTEHPVPAR